MYDSFKAKPFGIKYSVDLQLQLQHAHQDKRVIHTLTCSALYSVCQISSAVVAGKLQAACRGPADLHLKQQLQHKTHTAQLLMLCFVHHGQVLLLW